LLSQTEDDDAFAVFLRIIVDRGIIEVIKNPDQLLIIIPMRFVHQTFVDFYVS
jgi:hypothetical protein